MEPEATSEAPRNLNEDVDIPADRDRAMGTPITFLDKLNPEQFEIVKIRLGDDNKDLRVGDKTPYFRVLVRRT